MLNIFHACVCPQPIFLAEISESLSHVKILDLLLFIIIILVFRTAAADMEVPRLRAQSELQPPAYTTVIATQDESHVCDLYHSSRQRLILNPLSEARDRTATSWLPVRFVSAVPQWELSKPFFFLQCGSLFSYY